MVVTMEGRISFKRARIRKLKNKNDKLTADATKPPQSYLENNENESMCQAIASDYTKKILQMSPNYSNRMFVNVKNEYQVSKCVCTTIKPELLSYPTIHDAADCAEFVAHYFDYEPLEDPTKPPENIPSPSQIISWGIGDCFDLSFILASFLIGAGYDAYVVYGIAPKWICSRDTSGQSCPERKFLSCEEEEDERKILHALQVMHGENGQETALDDNASLTFDEVEADQKVGDDLQDKRVHCWVLVKANMRCPPGSENFYLEPSTGRQYHPSSCPYKSIYAMWNTHNYWLNKVENGNVRDFDFESNSDWDSVFMNKRGVNYFKLTDSPRMPFDPPFSWVKRLVIDEDSFGFRYPSTGRRYFRFKNEQVQLFSEGVHKQGLQKRITYFKDEDLLQPSHCSEYFYGNRKDGLNRRIKLLEVHCFHESFSCKNQSSIVEWIEIPGFRRKIIFNWKKRPDGLTSCDEVFGKRIIHSYEDRRDRLLQRVIFLTWTDELKQRAKNGLILSSGDGNQNTVVEKIVEKYKRPLTYISGKNEIASRILCFQTQTLETQYFDSPGGVTKEKDIYSKAHSQRSLSADEDSLHHHQELISIEKGVIMTVRNIHQESLELYRLRRREEGYQRDSLYQPTCDNDSPSVSARSMSPTTVSGDKKVIATSCAWTNDYLSPYLVFVQDVDNITIQEALKIKESCVSTMKERILERTNIIQKRLMEENERLNQHQISYQHNVQNHDERTDDFEKMCSDITFKIQILEKRLQTQEDSSLGKLRALENKLDNDPRLKILHSNDY